MMYEKSHSCRNFHFYYRYFAAISQEEMILFIFVELQLKFVFSSINIVSGGKLQMNGYEMVQIHIFF